MKKILELRTAYVNLVIPHTHIHTQTHRHTQIPLTKSFLERYLDMKTVTIVKRIPLVTGSGDMK